LTILANREFQSPDFGMTKKLLNNTSSAVVDDKKNKPSHLAKYFVNPKDLAIICKLHFDWHITPSS